MEDAICLLCPTPEGGLSYVRAVATEFVVVNAGVTAVALDGRATLLAPGSTDLVLLDERATTVWALLAQGQPSRVEDLARFVGRQAGLEPEDVLAAVVAVVQQLQHAGVLTMRST